MLNGLKGKTRRNKLRSHRVARSMKSRRRVLAQRRDKRAEVSLTKIDETAGRAVGEKRFRRKYRKEVFKCLKGANRANERGRNGKKCNVSSLVEALYCNAGRDQRSQHGQ
jgi:hypothetical protein